MITAIVQFGLPAPLSLEQARQKFAGSAPRYIGVDGLVRKYFLLSDDRLTAGGVYLWESREAADLMYTDEWRRSIAEKYGAAPVVTYYDAPVLVDCVTGDIQA